MRVYELVLHENHLQLNNVFSEKSFVKEEENLYLKVENSDEKIKVSNEAVLEESLGYYMLNVEPCISKITNDVKVISYLDKEIEENGILLLVNLPAGYIVDIKEINTITHKKLDKSLVNDVSSKLSLYISKNDIQISVYERKTKRLVLQTVCNY